MQKDSAIRRENDKKGRASRFFSKDAKEKKNKKTKHRPTGEGSWQQRAWLEARPSVYIAVVGFFGGGGVSKYYVA